MKARKDDDDSIFSFLFRIYEKFFHDASDRKMITMIKNRVSADDSLI